MKVIGGFCFGTMLLYIVNRFTFKLNCLEWLQFKMLKLYLSIKFEINKNTKLVNQKRFKRKMAYQYCEVGDRCNDMNN
jgi:hypothetical protein